MKKFKYIFIIAIILGSLIFLLCPKHNLFPVPQNGKWGYINKIGEVIIPPQFDKAYRFYEGLARVKIYNKWGFINKRGEFVIKPIYDEARDFSEGMAGVKVGDKWGFINKKGKLVIPPQFDSIGSFSEAIASVMLDGKWGYIGQTGQFVIQPHYDSAEDFSEGLAAVSKNKKYGFIDKKGRIVISLQFESALRFSHGLAGVLIEDKWGFIDKNGNIAIPPQFDAISCFSEGLVSVMVDGKWGYIDQTGQYVIKAQYDDAGDFSEKLSVFRTQNKYGYLNIRGNIVIEPKFDDAYAYYNGLTNVMENGIFHYINRRGNSVWKSELIGSNEIIDIFQNNLKKNDSDNYFQKLLNLLDGLRGRKKQHYFPLNTGMTWNYDAALKLPIWLGGSYNIKMEIENLRKQKRKNKKVVPRKYTLTDYRGGKTINFEYIGIDREGIFIYAEKSFRDSVIRKLEYKNYTIKKSLKIGDAWECDHPSYHSKSLIESIEIVAVTAGYFSNCLKVREQGVRQLKKEDLWYQTILGSDSIWFESIYWYAPDIGIIKSYVIEKAVSAEQDSMDLESSYEEMKIEIYAELASFNFK